jgi:hypothetical protein
MHLALLIEEPFVRVGADDRAKTGITDGEVAELASTYRLFGLIRHDLNDGLLYLSEDACTLYGIPATTKPVNVATIRGRIHPEDADTVFCGMEDAIRTGSGGFQIFRAKGANDLYRTVRLVMRKRENGTPEGDLIGILYEFFPKRSMAEFSVDG